MTKQINFRVAALHAIAILIAAGFAIQGCSDESNGSITGPVTNQLSEPGLDASASAARVPSPAGLGNFEKPTKPCDRKTAEIFFISTDFKTTYQILVNGKEVGYLEPNGVLAVKVLEGWVKWEASAQLPTPVYDPIRGSLFAERCDHYKVKVGQVLDRRQGLEPEAPAR